MNKDTFVKKIGFIVAIFFLMLGVASTEYSVYAKTVKLNKQSATIYVGKTLQLKVKNTKKKIKWYTSKKKVAWFSSNKNIVYADGKYVFAKAVGTETITAKCNGKSYICKVIVTSGEDEEIFENGSYTSRDKVALYIHTYHKLPNNFITKAQAQVLGWNGGSLLPYDSKKCIGGDIYSNYEGDLPEKEGRIYYECDVNTLGSLQRGAERIVYSNDGLIYYTSDHYETFVCLYN